MEKVFDVIVENCGTVWTFQPVSDAARAVFDEKVASEPWQWLGRSLVVDHRMARDLAVALQENEGLVLGP